LISSFEFISRVPQSPSRVVQEIDFAVSTSRPFS
jgi:hypothetical protein